MTYRIILTIETDDIAAIVEQLEKQEFKVEEIIFIKGGEKDGNITSEAIQ